MLRENLTKLNRKSLEKCHNAANCAKYIVADLEVAAGSAFTFGQFIDKLQNSANWGVSSNIYSYAQIHFKLHFKL